MAWPEGYALHLTPRHARLPSISVQGCLLHSPGQLPAPLSQRAVWCSPLKAGLSWLQAGPTAVSAPSTGSPVPPGSPVIRSDSLLRHLDRTAHSTLHLPLPLPRTLYHSRLLTLQTTRHTNPPTCCPPWSPRIHHPSLPSTPHSPTEMLARLALVEPARIYSPLRPCVQPTSAAASSTFSTVGTAALCSRVAVQPLALSFACDAVACVSPPSC
jgi:hypothetical protein